MKKYTKPSIKVLKVESVDVIQTSNVLDHGGTNGNFNTGTGSEGGWGTTTNTLNNVNPFQN